MKAIKQVFMNESQIPNIIDNKNNAETSAELINFEKIKSPEELLSYMQDNIEYGFVGKNDKKIYSPQSEGWGVGESPEYKLQGPNELLDSKHGTCWEQTELERRWFLKNNFEFKTFLLMFDREINRENPAHTLLVYKSKDRWCWFENSLDKHKGIHKFESLDDLIKEVKEKIVSNAVNSGASEDDIKKYKLYEYETSVQSCSSPDEFVTNIIKNDSLIDSENELYRNSRKAIAHELEESQDINKVIDERIKKFDNFYQHYEGELISKMEVEKLREDLNGLRKIENKKEFINEMMKVLTPFLDKKEKDPIKFEDAEAKTWNDIGGFTALNRLVSYGGGNGDVIHLHHPPGETIKNKRSFYMDAMKKLAKIVNDNKKIKKITASSWIVGKHPRLFEMFGFDIGEIPEKIWQKYFSEEKREDLKQANISREKFLKKFLEE